MKIYIAGPITGVEDYEDAFDVAAKALLDHTSYGIRVLNPCKIGRELRETFLATGTVEPSWADYMRVCVAALTECDAIHLLPGWTRSRGAILEFTVACALRLEQVTFTQIGGEQRLVFKELPR